MPAKHHRQANETDDAWFMRVYRSLKAEHPDCSEPLLFTGACDRTELPCLHPLPFRDYQSPRGMVKLVDFLETEPPAKLEDAEYRKRINSMSYCPVCDTWGPVEPRLVPTTRRRHLFTKLVQAALRVSPG